MLDFWNWMLSFFWNKDNNSVDVDDVAGMRKEEKHVHTPPPPLLLTIQFEDQSFYNLLDNRCQITRLPVLRNKSVLGSAYGWLVLLDFSVGDDDSELGGCCLWNPATLEIIDLPNLGDPYLYSRCLLSNPPTEQDNNCFIVFDQFFCWNQIICRVSDGSVFQLNREELGYSIIAMASFQGLIYGITDPGLDFPREFVTIHVIGDKVETRPLLVDGGKHHWGLPQPYLPSWVNCNSNYLIESPCGNELVLVSTMSYSVYQESGVHFRIFRVDVNRRVCEELENLDGRTVFIGCYGHGFCCYSESFGTKIKPNSIYYIVNKGMAMHIYDLDDKSTTTSLPRSVFDFDLNLSTSFWVDLPHNILDILFRLI